MLLFGLFQVVLLRLHRVVDRYCLQDKAHMGMADMERHILVIKIECAQIGEIGSLWL